MTSDVVHARSCFRIRQYDDYRCESSDRSLPNDIETTVGNEPAPFRLDNTHYNPDTLALLSIRSARILRISESGGMGDSGGDCARATASNRTIANAETNNPFFIVNLSVTQVVTVP
jgi:hypothetical protein